MRRQTIIACLLTAACGSQREPVEPRGPAASPDWRCVLRISEQGTFVDGEQMSRADAVATCKRAPGGAVVLLEYSTAKPNAAGGNMVARENHGPNVAWDETRVALEREGVRIYIRGPECSLPRPLDCLQRRPRQGKPVRPTPLEEKKAKVVSPPSP